ncbi:MAG: 4Fe-4S dicluster domain-containing protein [Planctomycetota bacterium]|jgi:Na+-translocating ferredoxin:NAD+ oxidoreductase RnfC subunit
MSLADAVRDAGVIGCGGAGFPTHVKVGADVDVVVANGAECEPLLNSDQRVMEERATDVVRGLSLVMESVGAGKGYIALKKGYEGARTALSARLNGSSRIELFALDNFYPAGDEQILLTEVTGKIVPEGGIPLNVSAVVSNVLTMVQVAEASEGVPVTERPVTLTGEVLKPQVVTAPIGTPVADLLDLAVAAMPAEELAVIDGGPMMGKLSGLDGTLNKTSSGFIFLPKEHPLVLQRTMPMEAMIRRSVAACCQCRLCTDTCSRFLQGHAIEPHLMMRTLAHSTATPPRAATGAFLCSQCGICEFACPMRLSPRRAFAELLRKFSAGGMKNPHSGIPVDVHEFRRYRKIGKDRIIRRHRLSRYDSHDLPLSGPVAPGRVRLALKQSLGAPSEPVVKPGDKVTKGDLVARIPEGKLGSNLHASIAGTVSTIEDGFITLERA